MSTNDRKRSVEEQEPPVPSIVGLSTGEWRFNSSVVGYEANRWPDSQVDGYITITLADRGTDREGVQISRLVDW